MTATLRNARAGGTINVCVFVKADTGNPNGALQAAGATVPLIGISANFNRQNPDPSLSDATALNAALVGEVIAIHPAGAVSVDLTCNATWNPGDQLTSDASGFGVVATTGQYVGARAETVGVVGALCPVTVLSPYLSS